MNRFVAAIAVLVGLSSGALAQPQPYPNHIIHMLQGFPPGGNVETIARADPDGYTLLVLPSAHPAYAALAKNVKFKAVDDFTWISVASFYPFMIAVKADSRFQSLKQIIDEARAKQGELKYGSA